MKTGGVISGGEHCPEEAELMLPAPCSWLNLHSAGTLAADGVPCSGDASQRRISFNTSSTGSAWAT
jgi:hypothetical protein